MVYHRTDRFIHKPFTLESGGHGKRQCLSVFTLNGFVICNTFRHTVIHGQIANCLAGFLVYDHIGTFFLMQKPFKAETDIFLRFAGTAQHHTIHLFVHQIIPKICKVFLCHLSQ